MKTGCCDDCNNGNPCGNINTSNVTNFDGTFTNIQIPEGSGLNEVLSIMEDYFNQSVTNIANTSYVLAADNCLGLAAGTYGFQQILTSIITKLCAVAAEAGVEITTDEVLLGEINYPDCAYGFEGTTLTELIDFILGGLCAQENTGVPLGDPYGEGEAEKSSPIYILRSILSSVIQNKSYVYDHDQPATDPNILGITVNPMRAVVAGWPVFVATSVPLTFAPTKDVYVLLDSFGDITKIEQTIGSPAPAVGDSSILLYKIVTSGTGVASLTNQFDTTPFDPPTYTIPSNTITNAMIQDNVIAPAKLADVLTASTKGVPSVIQITYNAKGQITAVTSNITLTGISNGQILVYDSGIQGFVNADQLSTGTNGRIPLNSGGDFIQSSIGESTNQMQSYKKVEVNSGAAQDDPNLGMNVVVGGIAPCRISATAASALTGVQDGTLIYVNTTNGTFTSVGFWGMEDGAWTKL